MLTTKTNNVSNETQSKKGRSFFPAKETFVQPKLTINQPNDIYEQEADAVAEKVMRMPDTKADSSFFQPKPIPLTSVQRKCAACESEEKLHRKEDEEEEPVQLKPAKEFDVQRKCSHCEEEEEKVQMKGEVTASGGMAAPSTVHSVINSGGQPLDRSTRNFMESRFGHDFGDVQIHNDPLAHRSSAEINALAYTHGNHIVFGSEQYQPNTNSGKQLLAHELAHVVQQDESSGMIGDTVQREMKFELQTKNHIWRNDGSTETRLERKYGPKDFLHKGATGARLESETGGVIEFETGWSRTWSNLKAEIEEAFQMTQDIDNAPPAPTGSGRQQFPFGVSHLKTGTTSEVKSGVWSRKKGFEGGSERILKPAEELEIEINDRSWNAGIQSSEGFYLEQYESFLKQHEWADYNTPVITTAQNVLNLVNTKSIPAASLVNLLNFLEIIINYIMRGEGGVKSENAGAFKDVRGMASKQAFTLMSRTNFASMYKHLLSKQEQGLYTSIVKKRLLLNEMGLTTSSLFFVNGYGMDAHHQGPKVHDWLVGIYQGNDWLSVYAKKGISSAMGKFPVEKASGKDDTMLVKFETRNTTMGAFADARDWTDYAEKIFLQASVCRPRAGTGTELIYDGSKTFSGSCP